MVAPSEDEFANHPGNYMMETVIKPPLRKKAEG
jgi:hypothetical protein